MAGPNIGEADVRIVADTDGFRQDVREGTQPLPAVDVTVNPELGNFRQEVRDRTKGIKTPVQITPRLGNFRSEVRTLTQGIKTPVQITPKLGNFRSEVRALTKGIKAPVEITPRLGQFRREVKALTKGIKAPVHLTPDADLLRTQVRAILAGMTGEVRVRCVSVGPNPCGGGRNVFGGGGGGGGGRGARIGRIIGGIALAGLVGPISLLLRALPQVINLFGALWRISQGAGEGLRGLLGAFGAIGGAIASAAAPFAVFVALLPLLAAGVAALYQPLGALLQGVVGLGAGMAALPAALSIGAAGLFTMVFALHGVGDAFTAALGTQEQFESAIQDMSGSLKTFTTLLRSGLKPLQELASEAFLGPVVKAMKSLEGSGAGKALRDGLEGAADAMGRLVGSFLEFFGTAPGIQLITDSFGALEGIFDGIAKGMPTLLTGISDAVNKLVGGKQGSIESTMQGLTERFGKWLSKLALDGSIQRGWDMFVGTLKELWSIAGSLIGVMSGITEAMLLASNPVGDAEGRGPLGGIADGLEDLDKWINGPGMPKLIGFFKELQEVGAALWKTIGQIAVGFGEFMQGLFGIEGEGGGSFAETITQIGEAFAKNGPAIEEFGRQVGEMFKNFTEDGGVVKFFEGLGETIVVVTDTITVLIEILSALFTGFGIVVEGITLFVEAILYAIGGIADFIVWLGDLLNGSEALGDGIIAAFSELGSWLKGLWDGLWEYLAAAFQGFYNLMIGNSLVPDLVNGIIAWFTRLPGALGEAVASIPGRIASVFSSIWGMIQGPLQALWDNTVGFFTSLGDTIAGAIGGLLSGARSQLSSGLDGLKGLAGNLNPLNLFADGGVVNQATPAIVGEAGKEVIIPLTRPDRAAQLVRESGLMKVLAHANGGVGAGGGPYQGARDVAVHLHTPSTNPDILVRKMQRAMAAALT